MKKAFIAPVLIALLVSFASVDSTYRNIEQKLHLIGPLDKKQLKQRNHPSQVEEVKLGRLLFYDTRLSQKNNLSCASCHIPEKGFSNAEPFARGTHGEKLSRHVPHLVNLGWNQKFFWDGRAENLEKQIELVITSKEEMDMTFNALLNRLREDRELADQFEQAYPASGGLNKKNVIKALVAYELSIISENSALDRFIAGDAGALTNTQKLGLDLFLGKANCIACHKGPNLTDEDFHNVGVITDDVGRQNVDRVGMKREFEMSPYPFFATFKAFKTPSLRNVAVTAPYFHNGSESTLGEILDFYDQGGKNPDKTGLSKEIKPLNLTVEEKSAIIEFLHALTDSTSLKY